MTSIEKVKCSNCGFDKYTGSLHIHHLDHNHENNNPENLVVLCANCHFEHHHKNSSKHKNKKANIESVKDIEQIEVEMEEINNLKLEVFELRNALNKKQNLFYRYMERLPNELPGYYYQNRRIINELYEKMYVEQYMIHSDTEMKEAVQNKAII